VWYRGSTSNRFPPPPGRVAGFAPGRAPQGPSPPPREIETLSLPVLTDTMRAAPPVESLAPEPSVMIPPCSVTRVVWQEG
jgi:hypothetical protein